MVLSSCTSPLSVRVVSVTLTWRCSLLTPGTCALTITAAGVSATSIAGSTSPRGDDASLPRTRSNSRSISRRKVVNPPKDSHRVESAITYLLARACCADLYPYLCHPSSTLSRGSRLGIGWRGIVHKSFSQRISLTHGPFTTALQMVSLKGNKDE